MAKLKKLDQLLDSLKQVRSDPLAEASLVVLKQAFKGLMTPAIVRAAQLVEELGIAGLEPELVQTFARLMEDPVAMDPGCQGKQAIAKALYKLNAYQEDLFLQGIRHRQLEPAWGGRVDTAPGLRGTCALGLVQMNYRQVMVELADLLADPELEARIGAVRAIGYAELPAGVPLLRLRVKVGDELGVLHECLIALLQLDPAGSLGLVRSYLEKDPAAWVEADSVDRAEVAALALGESRVLEAFELLRNWFEQMSNSRLQAAGLQAMAMVRGEESIRYLLRLIEEENWAVAKQAIAALKPYRMDESLWQEVVSVVMERGERALILELDSR